MWPPLSHTFGRLKGITGRDLAWRIINEILVTFLRSALFLSSRGLLLLYLFIASFSLQIGLSVLLWQQLTFIYEGKTYLSNLSSQADNEEEEEKKDCQNLVRFFGLQYSVARFLSIFHVTRKRHDT
jgi:palmitoyltransferase